MLQLSPYGALSRTLETGRLRAAARRASARYSTSVSGDAKDLAKADGLVPTGARVGKIQRVVAQLLVDVVGLLPTRQSFTDLRRPGHGADPASERGRPPNGGRQVRQSPARGFQDVAELGGHPRPPHRPTADVRALAHVDRAGHVGVAVPEQEGDLVDALAGKQRAARDGVPEAVHRRDHSVRRRDGLTKLIADVQRWEGRLAVRGDRPGLRAAQRSCDVCAGHTAAPSACRTRSRSTR